MRCGTVTGADVGGVAVAGVVLGATVDVAAAAVD
jgi:hypothetical protein